MCKTNLIPCHAMKYIYVRGKYAFQAKCTRHIGCWVKLVSEIIDVLCPSAVCSKFRYSLVQENYKNVGASNQRNTQNYCKKFIFSINVYIIKTKKQSKKAS